MIRRRFIDVARIYALFILTGVFYTFFFSWGIREAFELSIHAYEVVRAIIFIVLMIVALFYAAPTFIYVSRGGKIDPNEISHKLSLYLGSIATASLITAIVMITVEDAIELESIEFKGVAGMLFVMISAGLIMFYKKKQRREDQGF